MLDDAVACAIDWTRIERWTAKLVAGESDDVCGDMRRGFGGEPRIVWNPQAPDLTCRKLRSTLEYWNDLRRAAALPLASDIDPLRMRAALGYVMLLDIFEGGRDFRYRLYGSVLASVSGFDMTGRLLSSHLASTSVVEFSLAVYRAAAIRREPVFTSRKPVGARHTAQWQRVAMPLVDRTGTVIRFLACTVPFAANGAPVSTGM